MIMLLIITITYYTVAAEGDARGTRAPPTLKKGGRAPPKILLSDITNLLERMIHSNRTVRHSDRTVKYSIITVNNS